MTSYLNSGYDAMNYFAKFEKFLPHSIIIPSFMTIGSQMPELDWGGGGFFASPPYKIGSQNIQHKLGLNQELRTWRPERKNFGKYCSTSSTNPHQVNLR